MGRRYNSDLLPPPEIMMRRLSSCLLLRLPPLALQAAEPARMTTIQKALYLNLGQTF